MNKNKSQIRKFLLPFMSLAIVAISATSCSFSSGTWTWEEGTKDHKINYCLFIGQIDHNDSAARTAGIREALGTRVEEEQRKSNANLEEPVKGEISLESGSGISTRFEVNEIEHKEMKSLAGVTWDASTANSTASTWLSKHGSNITMFISNNDGMAEGAYYACNRPDNMPIFGYDANASTLKLIYENKVQGTIDSVSPAQCATMMMLIRNIYDNKGSYGTETKKYDPTSEGFNKDAPNKKGYGYVTSKLNYVDKDKAAYVLNQAVVPDDYYFDSLVGSVRKISDFFTETGEQKPIKERANESEPNLKNSTETGTVNVYQTYYSNSDTYLAGNMEPCFDVFAPKLNINLTVKKGDGNAENDLLNAISTTGGKFNAYLINPIKQVNSMLYIKKIAEANDISEKDKWEDRSDIPVIFWNRQPTDSEGKILDEVMNNKYFKYTYYVGFSAAQGGEMQGEMIYNWLETEFKNKENK